ncbi:MAG: precorrin-8X methylmutase [Desulfonauticus sp.]|nr:precorrin-8X methylmutase [Desulfonauticus sp.]
MRGIIILGHGSRHLDAQKNFLELVQRVAKRFPFILVRAAFFSLASPNLKEVIAELVGAGVKKIWVYPFFLSPGVHIQHELPLQLEQLEHKFKGISIELLPIFGQEPLLEELIFEHLTTHINCVQRNLEPTEIEKNSFSFIEDFLLNSNFSTAEKKILTRVIHATCDFSFISSLKFHPEAVSVGVNLIKQKAPIFCDVHMVKAGLTGLDNVFCAIDTEEVKLLAKQKNTTRARANFLYFGQRLHQSLVVIGNAPTGLQEVLRLAKEEQIRPSLVIGVPVGFVGACSSKKELMQSDLIYISNHGPRGGSSVAAAIVNGLKKMAF